MKKGILLLLTMVVMILLVSCGSNETTNSPESGADSVSVNETEELPKRDVSYTEDGEFNADAETILSSIETGLNEVPSECTSFDRKESSMGLITNWSSVGGDVKIDLSLNIDEDDEYVDITEPSEVPDNLSFICTVAAVDDANYSDSARTAIESVLYILQNVDSTEFDNEHDDLKESLESMASSAKSGAISKESYDYAQETIGSFEYTVIVMPFGQGESTIGITVSSAE